MILLSLVAGNVYLINLSGWGDSAWAGIVFEPGNNSHIISDENKVLRVGVYCLPELNYILIGNSLFLNQTTCNFSDYYFNVPPSSPQRSINFCTLQDKFLLGAWRRACTFRVNESISYVFKSSPFSWLILSRWQTCYNGSLCLGQTLLPEGNFNISCVDRRPFIYYIGNENTVFNGSLYGGHIYQHGQRVHEFIPSAGLVDVVFSTADVKGILYGVDERWLPGNRLYIERHPRILVVKPTHPKDRLWFNASVKTHYVYGCTHWINGCISGWHPINAIIGKDWVAVNTTSYEAFLFTNTSIEVGAKPKALAASIFYIGGGAIIKVYHAHFPVAGANVYINNTHYITDENGSIVALLSPGPYHVRIEKEGYLPLSFQMWIKELPHHKHTAPAKNKTNQIINITLAFPSLNGDLLYIAPPCNRTVLITEKGTKQIFGPENIHFSTGPHQVILRSPCLNLTLFFRVMPRDMFLQMENQQRFYVIDSRTGQILNVSWYWYCNSDHGQFKGTSIILKDNNCTIMVEHEGYIPLTVKIQRVQLIAPKTKEAAQKAHHPFVLAFLLSLFFILLGPSVLKRKSR